MSAAPSPISNDVRGPFLFVAGGFDFGSSSVPYFAITMRAEDAANFIRLPNELPVSGDRPIDLDELFQRELDAERVDSKIVPYLKSDSRPRFFNSLTVALLPQEAGQIAQNYAPKGSVAKNISPEGTEPTFVGQVTLFRHPDVSEFGYIAWDPKRTFPVVLDGQHRLFALKRALTDMKFAGRHDLANARISVLLLVLDPRAGYRTESASSVLSACRSIFTDVNKHAKTVSSARQYLLDDNDVVSACLRSVLESAVVAQPLGLVNLRCTLNGRMPLALIDWRAESAKFETKPYVSSLMALHTIVEEVLDLPAMPQSTTYDPLWEFVEKATARLVPKTEQSVFKEPILARLKYAQDSEVPFDFTDFEVKVLADAFRVKFGPRIVRPLTELLPYRSLIEGLEGAGYLSSNVEPWFSLDDGGKTRLVQDLEIADPEPSIKAVWMKAKTDNLAFQVVFQRAAVLTLNLFLGFPGRFWTEWNPLDSTEITESDFIDAWTERWNLRIADALQRSNAARVSFIGAGLRMDGTIDFRKTRASSIGGFMAYALMAPDEWWSDCVDQPTVSTWINDKFGLISPGTTADPVKNLFSSQGAAWKKGLLDVVRYRGDNVESEGVLSLAAEALHSLVHANRADVS